MSNASHTTFVVVRLDGAYINEVFEAHGALDYQVPSEEETAWRREWLLLAVITRGAHGRDGGSIMENGEVF